MASTYSLGSGANAAIGVFAVMFAPIVLKKSPPHQFRRIFSPLRRIDKFWPRGLPKPGSKAVAAPQRA